MLSSPPMVLLLQSYLATVNFTRIDMNANMGRFRDAYVEACFIMMQLNCCKELMDSEYPIEEIMKHSGWSDSYLRQRTF